MGRGERGFEIAEQAVKRPGQGLPPRDKNIVIAGEAIKGKYRLCRRPQPPFGTIALDGASDLAACGKAHPDNAAVLFRHGRHLQSQSGGNAANPFCDTQKIGASFQALKCQFSVRLRRRGCRIGQADSFLRPWARRRASTLRPPTVAMRARKPWRRFRTILLG